MLRNSQYPWNWRIGGGSTFVYFLANGLPSCITLNNITLSTQSQQSEPIPPIKKYSPFFHLSCLKIYPMKKTDGSLKQNILFSSEIMLKQPTIINMSLNPLRDTTKTQESPPTDKTFDIWGKNSHPKDEAQMKDLICFINIVADERSKLKNKEKMAGKEGGKKPCRTEKDELMTIPLPLCESVGLLIRKYLLFKVEEKQEGPRKSKISHQRSPHLRVFQRVNNENEPQHQEQDEAFRSIAAHRTQKEKLLARNQELQGEVAQLRERLKEKNNLVSKLISKEGQLRRKYNEEMNRLLRNRNIINISANFERQEEEGEGRNALNVTGRGKKGEHHTEEELKTTTAFKSLQRPTTRTLIKCDSEYIKQVRPRASKTNKLHPFRPSRKPFDSPAFLKTINNSLPTEIMTRRETDVVRRGRPQGRPTLELYISQLESVALTKLNSLDGDRKLPAASKMRDEQFQALQLHGFYDEQPPKEQEVKAPI